VTLRHCRLIAFLAILGAIGAHAQDLVAVAPDAAHVEFEDAHVRIVRLRIPENGAIATHDRPRRVVISLTANDVRLIRPDGTEKLTKTEAGTVAWSEATVRSVRNLGGELENIVIELKDAAEATVARSAPPVPTPAGYLSEPWHRWLFENQYVRVYDVRIPPHGETILHQHRGYEAVAFISGGRVSEQRDGEGWGAPMTIEPGSVSFPSTARQPFAHRVRNESGNPYHVILVQLLEPVTGSR
jgi:hypothetical protein